PDFGNLGRVVLQCCHEFCSDGMFSLKRESLRTSRIFGVDLSHTLRIGPRPFQSLVTRRALIPKSKKFCSRRLGNCSSTASGRLVEVSRRSISEPAIANPARRLPMQ